MKKDNSVVNLTSEFARELTRLSQPIGDTISAAGTGNVYNPTVPELSSYVNYSDILSHLIKEAGKVCKRYSSDLFISWESLLKSVTTCLKEAIPFKKTMFFGFRENGVDGDCYIYNWACHTEIYGKERYVSVYQLNVSGTMVDGTNLYETKMDLHKVRFSVGKDADSDMDTTLFDLLKDSLPCSLRNRTSSSKNRIWTNGEEIICNTVEEAEGITELLNSIYRHATGYSPFTCYGYYEDDCVAPCAGWYYVTMNCTKAIPVNNTDFFGLFTDSLPESPGGRIWSDGEDILCVSSDIAECVADLLECLYQNSKGEDWQGTVLTGYYAPREDDGWGRDSYTGWHYVNLGKR